MSLYSSILPAQDGNEALEDAKVLDILVADCRDVHLMSDCAANNGYYNNYYYFVFFTCSTASEST